MFVQMYKDEFKFCCQFRRFPWTSHEDVPCTSLADCSIMTCQWCAGQEQDSGPLHPRVISTVSRTVAWDYWQRNSPKELIIYPHTWPWNTTVNLNDLCETWRMVSLLYWWHHSNQMDENGVMYLDFPNQAIMTWLAHSVRSVSVNMWLIQWVMSSSKCDPFGRKCHRQTVTSSVGNTVRLWPVQWEMSSSNCCFQV